MLKIVSIPNPVLTNGTKKVEQFDESLAKLLKEMDQTLISQVNPQGVGLAAPQVGVDKAIFIMKPTPEAETEAIINPHILKTINSNSNNLLAQASNSSSNEISDQTKTKQKKPKKKKKLEGCLSIPRIWGGVERASRVYLEFQDASGKKQKKWFTGFKAVIIQHEVDHLNGILFTQRALEQNSQLFEEKEGELKKLDTNL